MKRGYLFEKFFDYSFNPDKVIARSTLGRSNSTISPLSITITLSESIIVFNLWAIVNIVHSLNSVLMVF
uniref:Uncharacterized protein n=1 Tax=Megaselia scalaris TaxID=36166 RepID=T1GDV8_MEGSC